MRPLTHADTRKARNELAGMLRERATDAAFAATLRRKVLEGLLAAPLVLAKGAYDARVRRCVARVAAALDYDRGWLQQSERAVAVALRSAAGPAPTVKRRESNAAAALRYAAIGAAATATGAAVFVTAGVAAPALAVALGGSTVWGASTVVTFTTTYSLFFAAGLAPLARVWRATGRRAVSRDSRTLRSCAESLRAPRRADLLSRCASLAACETRRTTPLPTALTIRRTGL